jgi:hypothetical protein
MDIPLKVKNYFLVTPRIPTGISVSFLSQVQDGGRLRVLARHPSGQEGIRGR